MLRLIANVLEIYVLGFLFIAIIKQRFNVRAAVLSSDWCGIEVHAILLEHVERRNLAHLFLDISASRVSLA